MGGKTIVLLIVMLNLIVSEGGVLGEVLAVV